MSRSPFIAAAGAWLIPALVFAETRDPETAYELKLLAYDWINFILFLGLLVYLLRKPVREFLARRKQEVTRELARVAEARRDLAAQAAALEARLLKIDEEIAAVAHDVAVAAEHEAERIRAEAAAMTAAIDRGVTQRIAGLEREAGSAVVAQAAGLLERQAAERLQRRVDAQVDGGISRSLAGRMGA